MSSVKKMLPKWKRIDVLSIQEEQRLRELIDATSGMSWYGNRARTSVMLPLDLAEKIAFIASQKEISVGQAVVEELERLFSR